MGVQWHVDMVCGHFHIELNVGTVPMQESLPAMLLLPLATLYPVMYTKAQADILSVYELCPWHPALEVCVSRGEESALNYGARSWSAEILPLIKYINL